MSWVRVLAVGGSDSGGGAGIEADVKTITALGGYAMTAITAVTAQDTSVIESITPIPDAAVRQAIRMVVSDLGVDAIKLGMLGSPTMVEAVADAITGFAPNVPLVVDPVLASTSGTRLTDDAALDIIRARLLPIATLLTPNREEAAALSGLPVDTVENAIRAARALCRFGVHAVLIKGGHFEGDPVIDRLVRGDEVVEFCNRRIETRHTHGTGCTLAAAIAHGLGDHLSLETAIAGAENFLQAALRSAPGFGRGHGPLGHAQAFRTDSPLA